MKNKKVMTHNVEKNESNEIYPKMRQVTELVSKDSIRVIMLYPHVQEARRNLNVLSRDMGGFFLNTQIKLLEMKEIQCPR